MRSPLPRGKTGVLVVSPTRELAAQIAEEAKVLATFHKLTVQARRPTLVRLWMLFRVTTTTVSKLVPT